MQKMCKLLLLAVFMCAGLLCAADAAQAKPQRYMEDFEKLESLPDGWAVEGDVTLDAKAGSESEKSILFVRTKENHQQPTSLVTGTFPAEEGIWEASADYSSSLYSPDSSFNGTLYLEALDKDGKVIKKYELKIIERKNAWKDFKTNVQLPPLTAAARFRVTVNKTYGKFNIDNLQAKFIAAAPKTLFTAIKIAPRAYASLFYPGDKVIYDVSVECKKEWKEPVAEVSVTDYWGAEMIAPLKLSLAKAEGKKGSVYKGVLDLSANKFELGKLHQVRATVADGKDDVYHEQSSFAIVPKAATKAYPPLEIPFTLNNWDDRMEDTFRMASRMGIPFKLVWSGWEAKPPYETYAPGIQWIKEEGMGALLGMRPISNIERQAKGYEEFDETALREGAKNLVNKYKDEMPIIIRCGNEPHGDPEWIKKDVAAYKAAYEGAKAAKPDVIFVGTSIGPSEEFFKAGFGKYLDKYDFHTYGGWKGVREIFKNYKEMFKKYGNEKGIWCTEIGLNSQGMARLDVARDMIKKFAVFFAEGGENLAWFDLLYPDPKGTITGSNGDSFNVFNCKYKLYSPRITAVTYYNMVNGICIKKFVQEKIYDGEIEAMLFRDRENRCMLVVWKEKGREDAFLPLDGVGEVKVVRIDGASTVLNAAGKGVTLSFDENPQLLFFDSADMKLADKLQPAKVSLKGAVPNVVMGTASQLVFSTEGGDGDVLPYVTRKLSLVVPIGWKVAVDNTTGGTAAFTVTSPEKTTAEIGMVSLISTDKSTLLSIPMNVNSKISLRVVPESFAAGKPGVRVTISNNSAMAQEVDYSIALTQEIVMENGTFSKAHGLPFNAEMAGDATGKISLAARTSKDVVLSVANFNPKNIYQVLATATDSSGDKVYNQRYISGFVGVPKVSQPLKMDLAADRAVWEKVPTESINEERQYYRVAKDRAKRWEGVNDLSAEIRYLWDEKYLYMKVDVVDDKYVHDKKDGGLWNMDGLQLLVDPSREIAAKGGYYDIALGEGTKGSQVFFHSSADSSVRTGLADDVIMKTYSVMDGGKAMRSYIIAMPWSRLAPFKPAAGNNIGMAVIVNEDDGKGRASFMGWFGCVHSKQLDLVGDLVLLR